MTTAQTVVRQFEILMEPDEDGFHVWCPALRGCHSWGATKDEARTMIREAIELWLEAADPVENPILDNEVIAVETLESSTPQG